MILCSLTKKITCQVVWLQALALLAARLYIANVFLKAGLGKVDSWSTTLALFEYEYNVPLLPFELAAYMATAGEIILPILLILGLFTPLGALGLIGMTAVIELFVYPGTTDHYYWLLLLGVLLTHGGGKLSADHFLMKRFCKSCDGGKCDV